MRIHLYQVPIIKIKPHANENIPSDEPQQFLDPVGTVHGAQGFKFIDNIEIMMRARS